jgi:hypothetical protein
LSRIDSLSNVGVLENALVGLNMPSENLPLAQEGIFLAFEEVGRYPGAGHVMKGAFPWPLKLFLAVVTHLFTY